MNKLIEVLEVQTYSHDDKLMRAYLTKELASIEGCEFHDDGDNIYAGKGVGPRPCMIAHMDTVHKVCENLTAVVINGKITGMNATKMEQTGIGGDDKVGIYVALQMLREMPNIKCFFPRDEEVGCLGSAKVQPTFFDDVTIALQCDRRGNTDFITEASGVELSSKTFQADVLPIIQRYGYKFEKGMMTDVMELKDNGINVSMANISCGYYAPHTDHEYVDVADVHKVTMMCAEILGTLGNTFYPHTAPERPSWGSGFGTASTRFDGEWWNDDTEIQGRISHSQSTPRIHEASHYLCQDCWQENAIDDRGLCKTCLDWYDNRKFFSDPVSKKMDAPKPQRAKWEIEADLVKARRRLRELNNIATQGAKQVFKKKKQKGQTYVKPSYRS